MSDDTKLEPRPDPVTTALAALGPADRGPFDTDRDQLAHSAEYAARQLLVFSRALRSTPHQSPELCNILDDYGIVIREALKDYQHSIAACRASRQIRPDIVGMRFRPQPEQLPVWWVSYGSFSDLNRKALLDHLATYLGELRILPVPRGRTALRAPNMTLRELTYGFYVYLYLVEWQAVVPAYGQLTPAFIAWGELAGLKLRLNLKRERPQALGGGVCYERGFSGLEVPEEFEIEPEMIEWPFSRPPLR